MTPDKVIRMALWASVPFNAVSAYLVAVPASWASQQLGMPEFVPAPYPEILAYFITIFAVAYAWLAMQESIDRPLVAFAGFAKLGASMILALLWVSGQLGGIIALLGIGHLVFATLFFWWLVRTARYANK